MRDDRIGGLDQLSWCLGGDDKKWELSLAEKMSARAMALSNVDLYAKEILPKVTDYALAQWMSVSAEYAAHLYSIVAAAWPLLQHAYRQAHGISPLLNPLQLAAQIHTYDAAFGAYRSFGLANVDAASLYHDYYLCLGTSCNNGFTPLVEDMQRYSIQGKDAYGIGYTIDQLRKISQLS